MVGKLKAPAQTISVRIEGRVAGNNVTIDLSERLPEATPDNYFVASMLTQWRDSSAPDAPGHPPGRPGPGPDRDGTRFFRDEFNVQAVYAISADRLDHAEKLFQAAIRIDPASGEMAGMRVRRTFAAATSRPTR